jgi:hypothetical protein
MTHGVLWYVFVNCSDYVERLAHTKRKGADIKRQLEELKERRLKQRKLAETAAAATPAARDADDEDAEDQAAAVVMPFDWKTKAVSSTTNMWGAAAWVHL